MWGILHEKTVDVFVASGNSKQKSGDLVRYSGRDCFFFFFLLSSRPRGKYESRGSYWTGVKATQVIAPNTHVSGCPVKALLGKKTSVRLSSRKSGGLWVIPGCSVSPMTHLCQFISLGREVQGKGECRGCFSPGGKSKAESMQTYLSSQNFFYTFCYYSILMYILYT